MEQSVRRLKGSLAEPTKFLDIEPSMDRATILYGRLGDKRLLGTREFCIRDMQMALKRFVCYFI
jgi:hypothetical protein